MNKNHVVSLELAKKLKEAGYKQQGEFWWCEMELKKEYLLLHTPNGESYGRNNDFVTPLASELMERLSVFAMNYAREFPKLIAVDDHIEEDENICNALAKMYLYLAEHKLLGKDKV